MKTKHGGYREGAGRPRKAGDRPVNITVSIAPALLKRFDRRIDQRARSHVICDLIENYVRNLKG